MGLNLRPKLVMLYPLHKIINHEKYSTFMYCSVNGQRITVFWSMLSSMPIYFISLLTIPILVIVRLEWIRRDCLWEGGALEKKLHLVKWPLYTLTKGRELGSRMSF